jgi:hypothetical protein
MGNPLPSTANANAALTAWTASAAYAQLHTGNPGAAGTASISSVTSRSAVTWGTASGGTIIASSPPSWASWAGTDGEKVLWLSFWSLASGGVFQFSQPLDPPPGTSSPGAVMHTGNTLSLTALQVSLPVAA